MHTVLYYFEYIFLVRKSWKRGMTFKHIMRRVDGEKGGNHWSDCWM